MSWRVIHGDCREAMAALDADSIDAIVCDPPYSLGFMGRAWDRAGVEADPATWRAALRVLKPGAHLVAFGGTRTFHRLTCALEDAGFEIRDCLMWLYGSGFPKSLDVSKAIDKAAGAERRVVSEAAPLKRMIPGADQNATGSWIKDNGREYVPTVTEPATDAARQWQGWGTALKPAWEPIILARKPLGERNVAANVQRHGTGALNVDECRIGSGDGGGRDGEPSAARRYADRGGTNFAPTPGPRGGAANGRWPANLVLDDIAAVALDAQTGELTSGVMLAGTQRSQSGGYHGNFPGEATDHDTYGDTGGASRFFFVSRVDLRDSSTHSASCPKTAPGDTSESPTAAGIESGASPAAARSTSSSNRDGSGSSGTAQSPLDTKSTTATTTTRTIDSATCASSPSSGTTTTTNGCERITEPCAALSADAASAAADTGPSANSSNAGPARTKGTASPAPARISPNGERETESATTPTCAPIAQPGADAPTRFFYTSKASTAERGEGNTHPTVKPLDLMQWLCRLVTPPGGTVLDPFTGSGSTGIAALREGFNFIGVEQAEEYVAIARRRIVDDAPLLNGEEAVSA